MLKHAFRCLVVTACGATVILAQRQIRNRPDFNLSVQDGNAEHCADLHVEARGGELAQSAESFTMRRGEVPVLEINVAERGNVSVRGGDQSDYSVEVCKFAVARDRGAAEQMVRGITVLRSAGRFSMTAPNTDEGESTTYFLVHAPKDAPVDLETRSGAIAVRGVEGQVKVRATNGPIALRDCGGRVDATTVNGPIAFEGGGGDIHLQAENGPIAVKISGELWNGNQLEAHTENGPLSLKLPDNFRSGVRVESNGNSPMSCKAAACVNASSEWQGGQRVLQMNGSQGAIHVSTHNGPVAIGTDGKTSRII